MDKLKQKPKKEKPMKNDDKEKLPSFIADVKTIKENLKIREILRTVKMNSSMRMKAPRGSKVMQNKDFNDNEDIFEDVKNNEGQSDTEPPSATNHDVIISNIVDENEVTDGDTCPNNDDKSNTEIKGERNVLIKVDEGACGIYKSVSLSEGLADSVLTDDNNTTNSSMDPDSTVPQSPGDCSPSKARDRKLSLDHTILSRRDGLSQSELDLNTIGKSPLERKSSFFRKKMDSFLKNTTEIFKRQSLGSKPQSIQRRGSMSVSLQSLNEKTRYDSECVGPVLDDHQEEFQGSATSLSSSLTPARSNSSLSVSQSDRIPDQFEEDSMASSQPALTGSQPFANMSSDSIHSLNEAYIQESLLNSRAISMSSGLDSAHGKGRRKASRSNRVTWVASESLTDYFRRLIQDEKSKEMQVCHSVQDFSTIPENNLHGPKLDSKGRRLSYQRAVSGEDPVLNMRYQDSSLRRKNPIPENSEASCELTNRLAEFSTSGVPALKGFQFFSMADLAFDYILWAKNQTNLEEYFDWKALQPNEEARQAVIKELIYTEGAYIHHLLYIVETFLATAHALQDSGLLLGIETERLFLNIPDVLNASLEFWNITFFPMLLDAVNNKTPFNTGIMAAGFGSFRELFLPYEKYVSDQAKAVNYLRSLSNNPDFMIYLNWCHNKNPCNSRLKLPDILVKPMQRLTKYSLILHRIITYTDTEPERSMLINMETETKQYVLEVNRSIRQREELEKLDAIANTVDGYEVDFKDEDIDRCFRSYNHLNLRAPMVNCMPYHGRSLIYQGDLRFKDNQKEVEVRAILLTDMLLICKKLSKGGPFKYKMIRPKLILNKYTFCPKYGHRNNPTEITSLIYILLDDFDTSYTGFALSESAKDSNPQQTLKIWEQKIREAKLTYDLGVLYAKNPRCVLYERDSTSDHGMSTSKTSDDCNTEREARERVATMLHRKASVDIDISQNSTATNSFEGGEPSGASIRSGSRTTGPHSLRYPMHRNSTGGSSRNSRLSSYQHSTSATSHDEPQAGPSKYNYKPGSSVEHIIPPPNADVAVTSIIVNVVSESESESVPPTPSPSPALTPVLVLHKTPPPNHSTQRSASACAGSQHVLHVQNSNMNSGHSLPDLTGERSSPMPQSELERAQFSPNQLSASERLYQSHQELLQRNRLSAHYQFLTPDHRGTSCPPPGLTRATLKRGLAFSYSFQYPPLRKMDHVNSQFEVGPSPSPDIQMFERALTPVPSVSSEEDKKSKQAGVRIFGKKNKGNGETASGKSSNGEKS